MPFFLKPYLLLMVCGMLANTVMAQVKYKTEYFSSEDGLSHRMVSTMFRDDDGFMWFGTWNGINRFDGRTFKSFKTSETGSKGIHNDRVRQMVDDHKGFLWICTYDKFLYCFDKKTESFIPVSDIINKAAGKNIQVHGISEITGNRIWLITSGDGAISVPLRNITPEKVIWYNATAPATHALDSNHIFFIHKDQDEGIWISNTGGISRFVRSASGAYEKATPLQSGTGHRNFTKAAENSNYVYFTSHNGAVGVYSKKRNQLYLTSFPGETIASVLCAKLSGLVYMATESGKLIIAEYRENGLTHVIRQSPHKLGNMFEDAQGNLWVEAVDKGVLLFKKDAAGFNYYPSGAGGERNAANRFAALQDFNKTVWITFSNGELVYYSEREDKMVPALSVDGLRGKLFNSVYRIYYNHGILWIGSELRGITKLIIQRNVFHLEGVGESAHLPDLEVRSVYFDKLGRRWVSTQGGRLEVRMKNEQVPVIFDGKPLNKYAIAAYAIMEDSRGNIWIGTKNSGLYKAIPLDLGRTRYHVQYYPTVVNEKMGFRIYSILEDQSHNIWLGTYDAGLIRVSEKNGSCHFQKLPINHPRYPSPTFGQIRHLSMDYKGNIWVATTGGLLELTNAGENDTEHYKVRIYRKKNGVNTSLPDNDVLYIIADSRERMWICTAGGGLSLASRTAGNGLKFESFGTREGLSNDYVLNGLEDRQGNIWVATEGGLSCLKAKTKKIVNYDSYDGLPGLGFSEGACAPDQQGNLVFGTSQGVITFNPQHLQRVLKPSGMLLTSLRINSLETTPGEADIIKSDVNYLHRLKLNYNQNTIAINYIIPDYRRKMHLYSYRLVGLDDKWSMDNSGRAVFTDLSPGKYLFEVRGDGEDYNKTTYRSLSIIVSPPFWKTWWAYCVYALVILLIAEMIRRTLGTMMKLRNKVVIEQQLSEMKLNFFTNISHELRTPLTLIVNPLEQLGKKEKLSAEGLSYLTVINKNAGRMVHFINQLLDFRKVQSNKLRLNRTKTDLVQLAQDTAAHFSAEQKEKNIHLRITSNAPALPAYIDGEKIATVLYNLLANAFKFTPPGKGIGLHIQQTNENDTLTILVEDQGPGVKKEQLPEIFQLFHSGAHNNRQMKGVGIGLAFAKELVELHGGSIDAYNNEAGGLTVKFTLKSDGGAQTQVEGERMHTRKATEAADLMPDLGSQTTDPKRSTQLPQLLLVEDNDELRVFLSQQLEEYYAVTAAANGMEGYAVAQDLLPDLIVSDVMMPEMNGIEMLDRLKNNTKTSHIPVVLLTAKSSVESQIEGLQYGADFYITKPFNSDLLFASINSLLKRRARLFEARTQIVAPIPLMGRQDEEKEIPGLAELTTAPEKPLVTEKDELFLQEVIKVVEEKMGDYNFNIELMAGSMSMGRTTFYKKFKSLTGITPVEFVRDRRLEKAKDSLDAGGVNVSEAAYVSGFNNPKYFSTCFKDRFGVSPTDYLRNKK